MSKSDDQRAKIVDVARDLFAEKGYEATTTRELNKAIGIADGLLYYYFPHGKQEILDTIVRQGLENRINEVAFDLSGVTTTAELVDQLLQLFRTVWDLFTREDNYQSFMITVRERMLLSDDESSWMNTVLAGIQTEIMQALRPHANLLPGSEADVPVVASIIMDILQRHLYEALLISNRRELSDATAAQMRKELQFMLFQH